MGIKPEFEVYVSGTILPGEDIQRYIARVTQKAVRLDSDVERDLRVFARVRYAMKWYGNLVDFGYIDTFYGQVVRLSDQYLENWKLDIRVNYTEMEKGS